MTGMRAGLRSPTWWCWSFVFLGIVLRVAHVARQPALWHDEAALVLNVIYLPVDECFGKLLHHEASPPLFLVLERLTMHVLGDSETALRMPVLVLGCVALILFTYSARKLLPPWLATLAVALFACSDRLIWHAAEAKPYTVDVFVAVVTIAGFVRTRDWPLRWQCMLWMVFLPVAEWFSFPACFVAGGLLVALLWEIVALSLRERIARLAQPEASDLSPEPALLTSRGARGLRASWPDLLSYCLLGITVVGSFVALAFGPAKAQQDGAMTDCWVNQFADWSQPGFVPIWGIASTAEVLRYALMPLGQLLTPIAIAGAIRIGKRDRRLLTVLLVPLTLSLVAALLGKYPYGGVRVSVFAAPALILLVAAGTTPCWNWLQKSCRFAPLVLAIALALPTGQSLYRVVMPWPRIDFRDAVTFTRGQLRESDLIASDHWEVLYYMRDQPDQLCDIAEIADRQPPRVWVLTGTDPGIAEARISRVPADYHQVDARVFPGTIVVCFEHRPQSATSTSAGPTIP
ncbi:MAG TPA: hypothetical protein VHR66_28935 [Gemmataceae bacterium]|jgi:hypothetical protein|nr:hypothetical protein [Gemmataceae bacterium]